MSPNQNLSRRDFLKLTLTGLGATFLAACGRALGITPTPFPTVAINELQKPGMSV